MLERRSGLARGIYDRLVEDDRFSSEKILGEVQWRLNTMPSPGGFSAYQTVFRSNPADLLGWDDTEVAVGDMVSFYNTSNRMSYQRWQGPAKVFGNR